MTAINVIGNNELSVTLRYTGGFTTHAVTVIGFSGTINPQELMSLTTSNNKLASNVRPNLTAMNTNISNTTQGQGGGANNTVAKVNELNPLSWINSS